MIQYSRIEDNLSYKKSISNNQQEIIQVSNTYDVITYNIGFGAYTQAFSFFMDFGKMLDGSIVKGNYIVCGGDFNHDIAESLNYFETKQEVPEWVYVLSNDDLNDNFSFATSRNAPTCRSTDMPYEKGVNYTVVIDGFIVSKNIKVEKILNIDTDFKYSDHNPVYLEFSLN